MWRSHSSGDGDQPSHQAGLKVKCWRMLRDAGCLSRDPSASPLERGFNYSSNFKEICVFVVLSCFVCFSPLEA